MAAWLAVWPVAGRHIGSGWRVVSVTVELSGLRLEMIETIVASSPPDLFASAHTARARPEPGR